MLFPKTFLVSTQITNSFGGKRVLFHPAAVESTPRVLPFRSLHDPHGPEARDIPHFMDESLYVLPTLVPVEYPIVLVEYVID
jgi:hypothetical protein